MDGDGAATGGVVSGCLGSSEVAKSDRRRGRLARRGDHRRPPWASELLHTRPPILSIAF